jgi:CubicO group peptidase (beta-lactamase class C family)
MTTPAWKAVADILDQASAPGPGMVFPAAGLLVATRERLLFEHAVGVAGEPGGAPGQEKPCNETTVFDLASLTKPLVTAALTLDLIARGKLHFDTPVAEVLPWFATGGEGEGAADLRRSRITVRHLLHHDSGLPAYQRYFESFPSEAPRDAAEAETRRARLIALALAEPLERDPGTSSVYSDIGFLVLGAVVEAIGSARIDELAAARIFVPLGVEEAWYAPTIAGAASGLPLERTAATGTCEWRRREIHGEVQDENAWAMGGVASHAGLFATARAVNRLVVEWVEAAAGRGLVLDRRLVAHAWSRTAQGTWALGWDTPSPGASSAGTRVGASAVGHLGYTGTSIWIDRTRGVHVVLLTNRIACGRNSDAIRALRPRLHDAVFAAVDAERGGR